MCTVLATVERRYPGLAAPENQCHPCTGVTVEGDGVAADDDVVNRERVE